GREVGPHEQGEEKHLVGARAFRIELDAAARGAQRAFERREVGGMIVEPVEIFPHVERGEIGKAEPEARIETGEPLEGGARAQMLRRVERAGRLRRIEQSAGARSADGGAYALGVAL